MPVVATPSQPNPSPPPDGTMKSSCDTGSDSRVQFSKPDQGVELVDDEDRRVTASRSLPQPAVRGMVEEDVHPGVLE